MIDGGAEMKLAEVEIRGHLLDSHLLSRVLDEILALGGSLRFSISAWA